MAICENKLKANIQPNCNNLIFGGYRNVGWIFNREDLEYTQVDGVVDELVMKSSAKGFALQQQSDMPFKTNKVLAKGTNYNRWNTSVNLVGLEFSAKFYNEVIKPLVSGNKVVVILEHQYEDDKESAFEVFGLEKGLVIADGSGREEYNADTDGGYTLNLAENGAARPSYWYNAGKTREGNRTALDELITK